jgi:hypothetical protein
LYPVPYQYQYRGNTGTTSTIFILFYFAPTHYTDRETAYEIRIALIERFETINTMGLIELVAKFYEVVKVKESECPDEWFSKMLYLNEQIHL